MDSSNKIFIEYLRSYTNIITKNIYTDTDNSFISIKKFRKSKVIVILSADKESYKVILKKKNHYACKVNKMIEDGVSEGKYNETTDNTS